MGLLEWTIVDTPDSMPSITKEILNPNNQGAGINKIAIASDGTTIWAIVRRGDRNGIGQEGAQAMLYRSTDGGLSWSDTQYSRLVSVQSDIKNGTFVWDMAIAPDDPSIIVVACADINVSPLAQEVWISTDKGDNWENTRWPPEGVIQGTDLVSTLDISANLGDRKVLVGTRDGTGLGTNNVQLMNMSNYGNWDIQDAKAVVPYTNPLTGDVLVAKFSPSFARDSTIVVVYTDGTIAHAGTWLATGDHAISKNNTKWQTTKAHVEIRNSDSNVGDSPRVNEIITANLELPSDFSGQSASLRRFYVSTDAIDRMANSIPNRGVYRIDDNVVYVLMDNTATFGLITSTMPVRRVSSIAYWGTCASGKLLVGSVLGYASQAAVPTWFTDSPTVFPIPCWYPALKRTSGAAGQTPNLCTEGSLGYGNAQVAWSPDSSVAYVATGSASLGPWAPPVVAGGAATAELGWPSGYVNVVPFDESAFGLSRNNGETWNQISLINTLMAKLTDVAPSADCSTIYLASTNNNAGCAGFDSVWRSSINEDVVSPLPVLPIGQVWERVRVSPTNTNSCMTCSNWAILRLAPDTIDGQVVFWAAGGTSNRTEIAGFPVGANTQAVAWSPDYGNYWVDITPDIAVQDMAAESSTVLYILDIAGNVQKLQYTSKAWSNLIKIVATNLGGGHTIEAQAEGKVLIGNMAAGPTQFPASISVDGGASFIPIIRPLANVARFGYHAVFDPAYDNNSVVYVANDAAGAGSIWRTYAPARADMDWVPMLIGQPGGGHVEFYGIVQTYHGTLYVAHDAETPNNVSWCGVERVLNPLGGLPIPGLEWNCLDAAGIFQGQGTIVEFTLEPKSLKLCGCLALDTDTILWAIDNDWYASNHNAATSHGGVAAVRDRGMLWTYTDCIAKMGPTITMADGTIIGCDPLTGRNQSVDFTWEQLCLSSQYQVQIAKDMTFSLLVFDSGTLTTASSTLPALTYPPGGHLEAGRTYYWRVRVRKVATGQHILSPWSEVRSFTIESSLPATTPAQLSKPIESQITKKDSVMGKRWHAFIAHASEDKGFVTPLAHSLQKQGLQVWYDDFMLEAGDSIRQEIDRGLVESWYGIVVLSHNFFDKDYPQEELDGLFAIEKNFGKKVIVPIWYRIDKAEITKHSPLLAGRYAYMHPKMSIKDITDKIVKMISAENLPITN